MANIVTVQIGYVIVYAMAIRQKRLKDERSVDEIRGEINSHEGGNEQHSSEPEKPKQI